jgi:hypothetical protein
MFARATSGDKKNNNKFSPCSLKAIEPVLNAKARSSKGCFTGKFQSVWSFCKIKKLSFLVNVIIIIMTVIIAICEKLYISPTLKLAEEII